MSESNPVKPDSEISHGKHWAAIRDSHVIGIISMRVPKDVDFDLYRKKATDCLELLGQVRSGEVVEREGGRFFVQRPNHANRSKNPKPPREFLIYQTSYANKI